MTRTMELTAPAGTKAGAETGADLEREFQRLATLWHEETGGYSFEAQKIAHPAYQKIIALGPAAVPLILRDLERESDHWFVALTALTGEDPAAHSTSNPQVTAAWLQWGREKGYLSP